MKSLEMNEKWQKNQGDILTNYFISQLLIALEYQTCYQSNARKNHSHLIVKYEMNLMRIFMNFNLNIKNN